jgi:TetR/AcrR family transcriptional repressor of nem operon
MGRVSDAKERLMESVLELIWTGSYGSTTIDQICEKAGVKKGSFYYFFDSKAQLAAEAFDTAWEVGRTKLDGVFSASVPPLERLRRYCDFAFQFQSEIKSKYGRVLGCPQVSLGCEVCTQEDVLQQKVKQILDCKRKYIESAVRDAHASGVIDVPDAEAKSRMIMAYYEGLLTQARIQNDVEGLRDAYLGVYAILGVRVYPVSASKEVVSV